MPGRVLYIRFTPCLANSIGSLGPFSRRSAARVTDYVSPNKTHRSYSSRMSHSTSHGPVTATPAIRHSNLLAIDTGNLYRAGVGQEGVDTSEVATLQKRLADIHSRINADGQGLVAEFACLHLGAAMQPEIAEILRAASALRHYRHIVLIGIGGSSLGTKALCQAILSEPREHADSNKPELHFVENIDPHALRPLLDKLKPADTATLCISKSGGTIETVVQYLILRDWLVKNLGESEARRHQWVVTDPATGWLRELAQNESLAALPVPPRVGGRYSVLSAVGLLPLAAMGIDIAELLEGARANASRCSGAVVGENPALEIAALCYLLDTAHEKRISVMMPYINRLQLFVDWYCQLWAESLGKWDREQKNSRPAGTLPVRAMGAIDQHSQLQMYLESRHDKFFTFLELGEWDRDLPVPLDNTATRHFPYLTGRSMSEVIDAEFKATRQVITEAGHPNMTITLPQLNAHTLGQLIDLYQRVTVYTGLLYGINPLDQPSVEKGKRLAIDTLRKLPAR